MYVGQVDLNKRYLDTTQGVTQRDTGMRECSRIDQNKTYAILSCLVDMLYQLCFGIALNAFQAVATGRCLLLKPLVDICQRILPVVFRLTGTQQIQVGSIDDEQIRHISLLLAAIRVSKGNCA